MSSSQHDIATFSEDANSPFERIRKYDEQSQEYWSSREFAEVLGYGDYRNFLLVLEKAKTAYKNSKINDFDHFIDVTDMIEIGKGGKREIKNTLLPRLWQQLSKR
ncbi:MAG: hypothetical protein PHN64_08675 [Desulfovibrionaceae bacterium]|nr:hypothetical protein [Desulfovibrionaceae bacterium]